SPPESRSLAAGQLRELEKALAELRTEGEVPQEVVDLAAAAHERVHADVQALRELGAAAALAEALRAEIEGAGAQGDIARFREQLAGLSGERPAWLAGHPTAAALAISLERARQKLDEIAPPPAPAPKSEKKKPASKPARPFRDGHWDEIRGLLDKLEQHLAAGHLTEALEIEKQINGRAASAPLPAGLERQLKRHLAQLAQMRDWAKWGDDQGREQLIQAAEALLTQPEKPDVEALALQKSWQETGGVHLGRKDDQALWGRFHAAVHAVFARRDEQRSKHNEERARRDAERKARDDRRETARRVEQQKHATH